MVAKQTTVPSFLVGSALVISLCCAGACGDDGGETTGTTATGGGGTSTTGNGGDGGQGAAGGGDQGGSGGSGGEGGFQATNADCSPPTGSPAELTFTEVASGIDSPLLVTSSIGDDDRLYIVSRSGTIHLLKDGDTSVFLDISGRVTAGGERGLLGLAFHPDYAANGRFFVHYSGGSGSPAPGGDTVIEEYQRDAGDPDLADPTAVQTILTVAQPAGNHNGGSIEFSPGDGMLYIGLGDGGGSGDQYMNGQDKDTLLGALLRVDVDDAAPYAIPPGNITDGEPEIWDWGLRNPYRFSFDPCTANLYIGDVGQNAYEEIDVAAAGDGNHNWGWNIMEGNECYGAPQCDDTGLSLPVAVHPHPEAQSITGGVVYRGSAITWLRGAYLYGDFVSGRMWMLRWDNGSLTDGPTEIPAAGVSNISSFGLDNRGEAYVVSLGGSVYRIDSL